MELRFCAPLIGAEDSWLTKLKYENMKIKCNRYNINELKSKYQNINFDIHSPLYYDDKKGYDILFYELEYRVDIESNLIDFEAINHPELYKNEQKMIKDCEKVIYLINAIFGTIINLGLGNFYLNNNLVLKYTDIKAFTYYPSYLEDFTKINFNNQKSKELFYGIKKILEKRKTDQIFNTILELYNANLHISNESIAFVNLITCLEILFENSKSELTYQISRGVAVTLSKDKEEGNELFKKMKKLYNIRSTFIHSGIWKTEKYKKEYKKEPFEEIKEIEIRCFRKYIESNLNKEDFIKKINEIGYGDF